MHGARFTRAQGWLGGAGARRAVAWLALCVCCGALAHLVACSPKRAVPGPDLIVISIDTLRADHLGLYGCAQARTPHLDALGARSRVFTRASTPFPRTTPGLASLLTGLRPESHGSREVGEARTRGGTLAASLRELGYATLAVSANRLAGEAQGLDEGFGTFRGRDSLKRGQAGGVTDVALELVRAADSTRPMFLWVHYFDPHWPYRPPRVWADQPASPDCRSMMRDEEAGRLSRGAIMGDRGGRSSAALDACIALYDAEIAFTDHHLGRLLEGLEAQGRLKDAVTVVTADHGEDLGEHGLFYEHGINAYMGSARVPLIIGGRGVAAGRDDQVARLEDVAPTLLAIASPQARATTDGEDLGRRLRGEPGEAPIAYIQSGNPLVPDLFGYPIAGRLEQRHCFNLPPYSLCSGPGGGAQLFDHVADPALRAPLDLPEVTTRLSGLAAAAAPRARRQVCVVQGSYSVVGVPDLQGSYTWALYDLDSDPHQQRDVCGQQLKVCEALKAQAISWVAALPSDERAAERPVDVEGLRALGYME